MDDAFRRFAEQCPDAVLVTDRGGTIEYVNAACERLTGYSAAELVGERPALLKSGRHEADFYRALWRALLAGEEFRAVFCNRRKGGALYYEEKIVRPLGDGFASFGRDVTERAHEHERLAHAATHDSLTDLPNRRLFLDRLEQALRHAARHRETFTVALMDLDRFRETNNRFGHMAGDAVLRAVAERTLACLRQADTVARIGGDEFALILSGTGPAEAQGVLAKIVAANAAPVRFQGADLPASVSVGGCAAARIAVEELLERADRRLYEAKAAGGGRYAL
jgi:diguanylate cyclase (GGDEF)-like protein/PAS domain S-box-containing protein